MAFGPSILTRKKGKFSITLYFSLSLLIYTYIYCRQVAIRQSLSPERAPMETSLALLGFILRGNRIPISTNHSTSKILLAPCRLQLHRVEIERAQKKANPVFRLSSMLILPASFSRFLYTAHCDMYIYLCTHQ